MSASEAKVAQVEAELKSRYFGIIAALPRPREPAQQERNRLSRSLAAFSIEKFAGASIVDSAAAVTDGGDDNGIDAVYFERAGNRLWVIQSKIGNAADMGENKKFCDGVRDLVDQHWSRFNDAFVRLQPAIEEALGTEGLTIVGCQVHLGESLGRHAIADLDQLQADLNKFYQRFSWKDAGISVVHGWLAAEHAIQLPKVRLVLENWGGVPGPRRAFYGQVSAEQLAHLHVTHKKVLFDRNIRDFLGAGRVNAAIAATAMRAPNELFYLNNGLTAVCTSIEPLASHTQDKATFALGGFSIVNGAQTVGSLSSVLRTGGTLSSDAKVLITLIEVGILPDDLGPRITRARNTQNEIRGIHFAALDPQQERLRQELAVSGITYHYRPSEAARQGADSFTIDEAALALACLSGDTAAVVAAKKDLGQLHDANGTVYPKLFRGSLSGLHLCRCVRIYDYLSGLLQSSEATETGARATFFRHGRYFIMHILARQQRGLLDKAELDVSDIDKAELSRVALQLAELIWDVAERQYYLKGYLSVFRNLTDSEPLARAVMAEIKGRAAMAPAAIQQTDQIAPTTVLADLPRAPPAPAECPATEMPAGPPAVSTETTAPGRDGQ